MCFNLCLKKTDNIAEEQQSKNNNSENVDYIFRSFYVYFCREIRNLHQNYSTQLQILQKLFSVQLAIHHCK